MAVAPHSPQHVALVMLAPYASGAEHQTLALCRYLRERCRVSLLLNDELAALLRTDAFLREYTTPLKIEAIGAAFPAEPARTPAGALRRTALYPQLQVRLARALRRVRPDVVHLVLAPSFFAYLPLFRLLRFSTVLTLAGEMRYVRHFYAAPKRLAVRAAVRLADGLIACSEDELRNLRAVEPAHAARAVVLDNFTDVARWRPGVKEPQLVSYAARLHPEKGPLLFVEAAAKVARTHPNARFALFGKGGLEREVSAQIAALGLDQRMERGFTTDLAPHFARSTVFVSCQLHENLGSSSLLEAMASGNAVVATEVGETRRIVDEEVGVRVGVSAEALAQGIERLLDDPEGTALKGAMARERVLERYGPEKYVSGLMEVYARVLQARSRAG